MHEKSEAEAVWLLTAVTDPEVEAIRRAVLDRGAIEAEGRALPSPNVDMAIAAKRRESYGHV
jgi:Mg-chelatase subunit ChlI